MTTMRRTWLGVAALMVQLACAGAGTTRQDPVTADKAAVGRLLLFDATLSQPGGQSCASCHAPEAAFTDPRGTATSEGVLAGLFGARNAPTAAYAAFAPPFHWDPVEGM